MPSLTSEYVAGFFDGEGSVGFYRNGRNRGDSGSYRYRAKVSVCQTELPVIQRIQEKYGGRITTRDNMDEYYPNAKPLHRIDWENKVQIKRVIDDILPHLLVKQDEAWAMKLYADGQITASQGRYITKGDSSPDGRDAWTSGTRR